MTELDVENGLIPNILSLHGFWREGREMILLKDIAFWWDLVSIAWIFLAAGAFILFRRSRSIFFLFIVPAVLNVILALSVSQYTYLLVTLLNEYFPFYSTMRESQKFVAFLVPTYLILGYVILRYLQNKFREVGENFYVIFSNLAVLFFALYMSWFMWFGLSGQFSTTAYPRDLGYCKDISS